MSGVSMKGQEIFAVGIWNGMTFQAHDLKAMADAFVRFKDIHKIPLKLGHNKDQKVTDGKPALGWVTNIYVSGNKLLADFEDVPEVVAKAVKNKLYRRVSIELSIDVTYKGERIPFVVDAVALLGADLPAVNTLNDLNVLMARHGEFAVGRQASFSAVAGNIEETKMEQEQLLKAVADAVAPLKAEFEALKGTHKVLTDENTALKQQVATFQAKETADKAEALKAKRTRAMKVLDDLVAGKTLLPAQRDNYAKAFGIADDAKLEALDIDAMIASLNAVETTGKDGKATFAVKGPGDTEAPAGDFASVQTEIHDKTVALAAAQKLNYAAARDQVLRDNPKLAEVYAAGPKSS